MFESLDLRGRTLHGQAASIVWAYHAAATLDDWRISKRTDGPPSARVITWTLRARLGPQVDRFKLRQRPLLFAAPREGAFGLFCWPIRELVVGETTVTATLGPPEY